MGQRCPPSISAADWHAQMADFLRACVACRPGEQAGLVREANQLLRLAPEVRGVSLPAPVPEKQLETRLDAGAEASVALSLIGPDTGFMLSRGRNGSYLATVILPGGSEEFTARGHSAALALLAAQALAFLAETEHVLGPPHAPLRSRGASAAENVKRRA